MGRWPAGPDLGPAKTYKDIKQAVFDAYPNEPKARLQRTYGTRIIRSL